MDATKALLLLLYIMNCVMCLYIIFQANFIPLWQYDNIQKVKRPFIFITDIDGFADVFEFCEGKI